MGSHMGKFTGMVKCLLTVRKRKTEGWERSPQKSFMTASSQSKESALFDINRALLKGHGSGAPEPPS